jgi:hypothetical protein
MVRGLFSWLYVMERTMTDDATLCWLMLLVGTIPVVGSIVRHVPWGYQPTLGAILSVGAAYALLSGVAERRRRAREGIRR